MAMSLPSCGRSQDDSVVIRWPDDRIITAPVNDFSRISGLGVSTVWKLIAEEELETISVGKRRLVVLDSYRRFVERKLAEAPQDARRNNCVPAAGSKARRAAPTTSQTEDRIVTTLKGKAGGNLQERLLVNSRPQPPQHPAAPK
jgi:hypothetical protein